jgi:formylglycine-generating enzyme required for sulfatase activity
LEELGDLPRLPPLSTRAGGDPPPPGVDILAPGAEFRDGDSLPLMVVVPQGAVVPTRGRRTVLPAPLAVGKHPVLVGEWRRFVEVTGFETGIGVHAWNGAQWVKVRDRDWRDPGYPQDDAHPVTCIDWSEANAYCEWLSGVAGHAYRLLMDDEWEYACRARALTSYSYGDTINPDQANFGLHHRGTTRAGAYPANSFGLHDMHGNVWEWTGDEYEDRPRVVRSPGSVRRSPLGEGGTQNSVRGGSWANDASQLRADTRFHFSRASRSDIVGFRVARGIAA